MSETVRVDIAAEQTDLKTLRNHIRRTMDEEMLQTQVQAFEFMFGQRPAEAVDFELLETVIENAEKRGHNTLQFDGEAADEDQSVREFLEEVREVNEDAPDRLGMDEDILTTIRYIYDEDGEKYYEEMVELQEEYIENDYEMFTVISLSGANETETTD